MNKLGRKLFRLVESEQGHAFISDAIEEYNDDARVIRVAEIALRHHENCVAKLRRFIESNAKKVKP